MKIESTACPSCAAQLPIHPGSQFCRCEHCGRAYVINWQGSESASLTGWEDLLSKVVDRTAYLEAGQRLQYIDAKDLPAADEKLTQKKQVHEQTLSYLRILNDQRQVETDKLLVPLAITAALAALLWYLVILVLEGDIWYWGLGAAIFFSIMAYAAFHGYWEAWKNIPEPIREAQLQVEATQKELMAAAADLKDLLLEREFCDRKMRVHRVLE